MKVTEITRESFFNINALCEFVSELHPLVQDALLTNSYHGRISTPKRRLPSFTEVDLVLVAREGFKILETVI